MREISLTFLFKLDIKAVFPFYSMLSLLSIVLLHVDGHCLTGTAL